MGGLAINTGDTAFVLICAALVALMTPGLAFFYGGLVRRKNFLAIMMQSFISMGVVTTIWVFFGYSLAFSGDIGGVFGNLQLGGADERRPPAGAVGAQHPGAGALRVPGDVRHHHPGAHHRGVRRPGQVQELPVVPGALEHPRVHPVRALDLGRRLAGAAGRARLRRRPRGARERRLRRAGLGVRGRQAPVRQGRARRAAQHRLRRARHRPAVVRLVRVQRRLGAGGQRHRRAGVRQHRHRRLDRHVHVAGDHLVEGRQAEPGRRAHRRRGRPRLHHAGRRLRPDVGGVRLRAAGRFGLLLRRRLQGDG